MEQVGRGGVGEGDKRERWRRWVESGRHNFLLKFNSKILSQKLQSTKAPGSLAVVFQTKSNRLIKRGNFF